MKAATFMAKVLDHRRVVLASVVVLIAAGLFSWLHMPRQEDPRLPDRMGILVTVFPGADTESMERLVVIGLEEELAQVGGVQDVETRIRGEVAISRIELKDRIDEVGPVWDEVEDAIAIARRDFPEGVLEPELNKRVFGDQETAILAVTGSRDPLVLRAAARKIRTRLLRLSGVSRVKLVADPGVQVSIEFDDASARQVGISVPELLSRLSSRNQFIPSGSIRVATQNVDLNPGSEFSSLKEIAETSLVLASGATLPLSEIAKVSREPRYPLEDLMRVQGRRGVALSVIGERDINVVELGQRLREEISQLEDDFAPLSVEVLSFQPDYVEARLQGLGRSLLFGIGIVALVLILAMGFRIGLLVSVVVPVVALVSVALYAFGGGVLQQMSVAALILALGLLVDNAIVVVESAQHYLDNGLSRRDAAIKAARDLAFPLATATGTTIAAFMPMLLASGSVGDFTRAIPIVTIITLVVSYFFAVLVTPILAAAGLRRRPQKVPGRLAKLGAWISTIGAKRPKRIVAGVVIAVGLSASLAGSLEKSFFPQADRNQFVIDVLLPEGTHLEETDKHAKYLEEKLLSHANVVSVASFVGRSTPRFYYNLPDLPRSPHLAQLMVEAKSREHVPSLIAMVREFAYQEMPAAEVIPRFLEQGPPLNAPIELHLYGEDLEAMSSAAEQVMAILRDLPATRNVRSSMGKGKASIQFQPHDGASGRRGVTRADVAIGLRKQTRGLLVGTLRNGSESVAIVLRSSKGEETGAEELPSIQTNSGRAPSVSLAHVSTNSPKWRPAVLHRKYQQRQVTVSAQLAQGSEFGPVIQALEKQLGQVIPNGVDWKWGGSAEGSGDANSSMLAAAPVGLLMLLLFILVEFNSFRRLGIILTTIPLAAAGVIPGLLLSGQAFGFMAVLGIFALVGVVVNNAIVLLSVIDARRTEGATVQEAIASGVSLRIRPILLTSATTVAGLLPLAFSSSPLWPPMAWAMIAGLIASTFLALLVVPAMYALLFAREDLGREKVGHLGSGSFNQEASDE